MWCGRVNCLHKLCLYIGPTEVMWNHLFQVGALIQKLLDCAQNFATVNATPHHTTAFNGSAYLVPALSQLSREMRQSLACFSAEYTVWISTLPHMIRNSHLLQSTPNCFM